MSQAIGTVFYVEKRLDESQRAPARDCLTHGRGFLPRSVLP
jgi:hypothetical protein